MSLATPARDPGAAAARLRACLAPADRTDLEGRDLLLVHRLDVGTTGLLLVALDEDAHRALADRFARRAVEKTYLALVWGRPRPGSGEWSLALAPDRADRRRMKVDPAGRPAVTGYRVLAARHAVALVELQARTGRTHQLRVHLAAQGHPIVGDDLYGGPRHRGVHEPELRRALDPGRPLLHAWKLRLPGETPEIFEAPLPADFRRALAAAGLPLDFQKIP